MAISSIVSDFAVSSAAKALESAREAFQGLLELAAKHPTVTRIIGGALAYQWCKRHGVGLEANDPVLKK